MAVILIVTAFKDAVMDKSNENTENTGQTEIEISGDFSNLEKQLENKLSDKEYYSTIQEAYKHSRITLGDKELGLEYEKRMDHVLADFRNRDYVVIRFLVYDGERMCETFMKFKTKEVNGKKKYAATYGMDELVEWFREEGILVEDNTPREEYYKVMLHTEKAWFYIIVLNVLAFTPAIVVILYYMHRDIPLETTREVFEAIVSYIVMIGMYIATWVAVVGEKTFYLKYQDGKYSYHHWFRKEKTFELDERITYKAREDGIVIYQDNKRLFLTSHGYTNAEFFGRTLLEKNIKCIKGEQYMEKYRDKGQEEI